MIEHIFSFEDWETYLKENIRNKKRLKAYLNYVAFLLSRQLPVIFELDHLARILNVKKSLFASMVAKPNLYYRTFEIPKRRGGVRLISTPAPTLLECQRWINNNILSKIPIHDRAHGFVKQKSIISNASAHLKSKSLLKLDLKDFFPSIPSKKIFYLFRRMGYPVKISYFLSSICCLNFSLPQGAATSPALSNIISIEMDARLMALANSFNLIFTRYADDIVFSGQYIPSKFQLIANKIIKEEGFILNDSKTRLISGKGKRIVTGISISGGELKLPKNTKRKIRQEVFYLLKNGYLNHTNCIEGFYFGNKLSQTIHSSKRIFIKLEKQKIQGFGDNSEDSPRFPLNLVIARSHAGRVKRIGREAPVLPVR